MVGVDGEAEATLAIDQANQLRMLGGTAVALVGLLLLMLAIRSRRKPISRLAILGAALLVLAGIALAQLQVRT